MTLTKIVSRHGEFQLDSKPVTCAVLQTGEKVITKQGLSNIIWGKQIKGEIVSMLQNHDCYKMLGEYQKYVDTPQLVRFPRLQLQKVYEHQAIEGVARAYVMAMAAQALTIGTLEIGLRCVDIITGMSGHFTSHAIDCFSKEPVNPLIDARGEMRWG